MNNIKGSSLLKKIMKDNELNQVQLASKLDVSKQYISLVLNNKKSISKKLYNEIYSLYPKYKSVKKKLELPKKLDRNFLEVFRHYYGYDQKQMADLLCISQTFYSLIINKERNFNDDIKQRITLLAQNPKQKIDVSQLEKNSLIRIDYQPEMKLDDNFINISCENSVYFDRRLIGNRNYHALKIVSINDDSMSPKFNLCDKVIVDFSINSFSDGSIFVFKFKNHIFVREIKLSKNKIKCIALNKKYDTFYITGNNSMEVLGEVLHIRL